MDDDLNSSDIEFKAPPVDPFTKAGARSIEDMLEHAVEDRLASKKRYKQLTFVHGSKKTQYINHLWHNRFMAYSANILRSPAGSTPTGEPIERFIASIAERVKPRSGHQVPSYKWLQQGLGHLVNALVFYFKDFTLSKHERSRLQTTVHQLFKEGKLTKDAAIEHHRIGVFLVRKLSAGLFRNALTNGTINWDVTIAKSFSIVLTAALASRTGDITTAPLEEHDLPFLCYMDITLKLAKGNEFNNLVADVLIRNEKGDKGNGLKNRKVTLEVLKNNADNVICPIKLLLIVALRHGNVQATTIDEVLRLAASRHDKTIKWVHPKRPVLCAFGHVGSNILVDKPAGNHQLTNNMAQAAPVAGFLEKPRGHDLRRGAAQETANLNGTVKGYATPAVAAVLGHSENSFQKGVTKAYVGDIRQSVYTMRVEENFEDLFGVATTEDYYVKRRKLTPSAITDMCKKEGLDSSDTNNRKKMGIKQRAEELQNWETAAKDAPAVLSERTQSDINTTAGQLTAPANSATPSIEQIHQDPRTLFIDPRLLTGDVDFEGLDENSNSEPTAAVEEAYFDEIVSQRCQASPSELQIGGVDFVRHFSKINITTNQILSQWGHHTEKTALTAAVYSGHSRDPVVLWVYHCENSNFGCPYKHSFYSAVLEHQTLCKITSAEKFAELNKVKPFPCDREGCTSSFESESRLKGHIKEIHDWKPRACEKAGCDPKVVFQSRNDHSKHVKDVHSAYQPTKCQFPGCSSDVIFGSSKTYRSHLGTAHEVYDRKEKDKYMPGKKVAFVPQKCLVSGCSSTQTFLQPSTLKNHLAGRHRYTEDEIEDYMS